jgi:hypothetical protein
MQDVKESPQEDQQTPSAAPPPPPPDNPPPPPPPGSTPPQAAAADGDSLYPPGFGGSEPGPGVQGLGLGLGEDGGCRCLWLRDISPPRLDTPERVRELQDKIHLTFEQFGYPQRVRVPRGGRGRGAGCLCCPPIQHGTAGLPWVA